MKRKIIVVKIIKLYEGRLIDKARFCEQNKHL